MSKQNPNQSEFSGKNGGKEKKLARRDSVEEYRLVPLEEIDYRDDEEVLDIIGILKDIWLNRKTVYIVMGIVFAFGLIVFLGSERIYYSEAKLMPETTSGQSQFNQIFQQAESLLGIQRGVEEEDIRVAMYPDIVESLPFQIELMQQQVYFSDIDQRMTIFEYFNDHYEKSFIDKTKDFLWNFTIGLPVTLWEFFTSLFGDEPEERLPPDFAELLHFEVPKHVNPEVRRVAAIMSDYITIDREPQAGYVSIGVALPDPPASTEVVILVRNLLQEYVTDYRTEKAQNDLEFVKQRFDEAKDNYYAIHDSLASFQDGNINVARQSVAIHEQRLESEFQLAFNLYTTLARRVQEAEIQVQKETPVFRVHEPAVVPARPSQPSAARVLGGSIFVGLFLGVAFIYLKRAIRRFRREFEQKEPKTYLA